jgi:hypothetical protein
MLFGLCLQRRADWLPKVTGFTPLELKLTSRLDFSPALETVGDRLPDRPLVNTRNAPYTSIVELFDF